MEIMLHPRVKKYLEDCAEKEKVIEHIGRLAGDPYNTRSGVDIKKLKGKRHDMYRLRVGEHRVEYFVEENKIWIDDVFYRGRGYR